MEQVGHIQHTVCHTDKLIITHELEMLYVLNVNIFEVDVYISRTYDNQRKPLKYLKWLHRQTISIIVLFFPVCVWYTTENGPS